VRRSGATWALLALCAAGTTAVTVSAALSVATAAGWRSVTTDAAARADAGQLGIYGDDALRVVEGWVAFVTVPLATVALALLAGLLAWREWAREAALGVFGLSGALLTLFSVFGLGEQARGAAAGLLAGAGLLAAAGLAVSPGVCADFDRRRIAREVQERRRLEQQRRAGRG
jgi:hypothetical protein